MKFSSFVLLASSACVASAFVVVPSNKSLMRSVQSDSQFIKAASVGPLHAAAAAASLAADPDKVSQKEQLAKDADMIFNIMDLDGSGTVSMEEMTTHLSASGYTADIITKIFNKIDTNKDGEISRTEFRNGFSKMAGLQSAPGLGNYNAQFVKEIYEDADALFAACDADGNGNIDYFELQSQMGRKFSNHSDAAIKAIFRSIDGDGNGTISKEELRDAFVRYSAVRQALGEGPNYK